MTDTAGSVVTVEASEPRTPRVPRAVLLNKLYGLPSPLRTFPLPTFIPHNPLSLFQLVYCWLSQAFRPPSSQPEPLYEAFFSVEGRSSHVVDQRSIDAIWRQGFYGKGSLSRSEPSWLDREKRRRGVAASQTSEEYTMKRRAERQQVKWERARKEREAIDLTLKKESTVLPGTETTATHTPTEYNPGEDEQHPYVEEHVASNTPAKEETVLFDDNGSPDPLEGASIKAQGLGSDSGASTMRTTKPAAEMPILSEPFQSSYSDAGRSNIETTSESSEAPKNSIVNMVTGPVCDVAAPPDKEPCEVQLTEEAVLEIGTAVENIVRPTYKAPVGPSELLALANSDQHGNVFNKPMKEADDTALSKEAICLISHVESLELLSNGQKAPVGPLELLALPNSVRVAISAVKSNEQRVDNGLANSDSRGNSARQSRDQYSESQSNVYDAPVGPLQLLALPNSEQPKSPTPQTNGDFTKDTPIHTYLPLSSSTSARKAYACPVGPLEILALPDSQKDLATSFEGRKQSVEIGEPTITAMPQTVTLSVIGQALFTAPVEPMFLLRLPNSESNIQDADVELEIAGVIPWSSASVSSDEEPETLSNIDELVIDETRRAPEEVVAKLINADDVMASADIAAEYNKAVKFTGTPSDAIGEVQTGLGLVHKDQLLHSNINDDDLTPTETSTENSVIDSTITTPDDTPPLAEELVKEVFVQATEANSSTEAQCGPMDEDNEVEVLSTYIPEEATSTSYPESNRNSADFVPSIDGVKSPSNPQVNGHINGGQTKLGNGYINHVSSGDEDEQKQHTSNETAIHPVFMKRRKSVRFSPTVEETTFIESEPPSAELAAAIIAKAEPEFAAVEVERVTIASEASVITEQEHLQLTLEESFFLAYGLGVLSVKDAETGSVISNQKLLSLCRQTSYFPARAEADLVPDDPFMLNYVVYHHFRSLGWCVRAGTKFSVDFLLYNRGPVFSHAAFGILVLPSYSDPYWTAEPSRRDYVTKKQTRNWAWLHCINRVIVQAKKSLVLVYVDIPPPTEGDHVVTDIGACFQKYKVREIMLKRWLPNRSRD